MAGGAGSDVCASGLRVQLDLPTFDPADAAMAGRSPRSAGTRPGPERACPRRTYMQTNSGQRADPAAPAPWFGIECLNSASPGALRCIEAGPVPTTRT